MRGVDGLWGIEPSPCCCCVRADRCLRPVLWAASWTRTAAPRSWMWRAAGAGTGTASTPSPHKVRREGHDTSTVTQGGGEHATSEWIQPPRTSYPVWPRWGSQPRRTVHAALHLLLALALLSERVAWLGGSDYLWPACCGRVWWLMQARCASSPPGPSPWSSGWRSRPPPPTLSPVREPSVTPTTGMHPLPTHSSVCLTCHVSPLASLRHGRPRGGGLSGRAGANVRGRHAPIRRHTAQVPSLPPPRHPLAS